MAVDSIDVLFDLDLQAQDKEGYLEAHQELADALEASIVSEWGEGRLVAVVGPGVHILLDDGLAPEVRPGFLRACLNAIVRVRPHWLEWWVLSKGRASLRPVQLRFIEILSDDLRTTSTSNLSLQWVAEAEDRRKVHAECKEVELLRQAGGDMQACLAVFCRTTVRLRLCPFGVDGAKEGRRVGPRVGWTEDVEKKV